MAHRGVKKSKDDRKYPKDLPFFDMKIDSVRKKKVSIKKRSKTGASFKDPGRGSSLWSIIFEKKSPKATLVILKTDRERRKGRVKSKREFWDSENVLLLFF